MNSIVIVGAKRTPIGAYRGRLAALAAPELGAAAIRALLEDCRLDPKLVEEVFMGCVLPAGLGQAPARQAALAAGVPLAAGCTTVNKVCGSGMNLYEINEAFAAVTLAAERTLDLDHA